MVKESFTEDCGFATCSIYLTRNTTKELCERLCGALGGGLLTGGASGVVTGVCTPALGPAAWVCGAVVGAAAEFFKEQLRKAADKRQCLRIRYSRFGPPSAIGLYVDGSRFCRN